MCFLFFLLPIFVSSHTRSRENVSANILTLVDCSAHGQAGQGEVDGDHRYAYVTKP